MIRSRRRWISSACADELALDELAFSRRCRSVWHARSSLVLAR
ncbi:hypothetical protein GBAR_LOCUS6382 [Geodia barretti]|uniref:Uncharacterized protein n=1 Tax=Geodia barretti TaxID=519541 RepID=A0AA35RFS6_GEOBA|nr:hypothetical protein GBAR_LOCUS6382 [Geodia barretti]